MTDSQEILKRLEEEIERRLVERFAALRDEFDRLRLESDHRWAGFLDRFDQRFTGIVPPELIPEAKPQPAAAAPGALSVEAARSLDDAGNQVEVLHRFLDVCRRYASRAALLVSRGGAVGVWKAVGFSEHGSNDDAARRTTPPSAPGSVLARVLEGHACQLPPGNEVSKALAIEDLSRAVLIPMAVKEKISGALYADCVASDESLFDPEALSFLTFLSGLIVDRLAGRKLKPAPALRALEAMSPVAVAPEPVPEPEFELAEEASAPEPKAESSAAPQVERQKPLPAPKLPPPPQFYGFPAKEEEEVEPVPEIPPDRPPSKAYEPVPEQQLPELAAPPSSATIRIPTVKIEAVPPAPPPPPAEPARPATPPPAAAPRISTGVRRLSGPLAPVEGDERRDEARRFAKLLVSEIKLYNEKAVQQGRAQGNIYELLREDIDRSRQMYDERIPEDVRANSNFFYDELVRILADGRAEALGM